MAASVLVQGWRGINHSYALVNQYQLLELLKHRDLSLTHEDLPFYHANWNPAANEAGFDDDRRRQIAAIPGSDGRTPDIIYRIGFPYRFFGGDARRILVFGTSESQTITPQHIYDGPEAHRPYATGDFEIVTPSNWSKAGFVNAGYREDRIHVIPHGVDPSIFRPLPRAERLEARRENGIRDDMFVFASVGSVVNSKGIDVLLLAFDAVHRKYPHTVLLLKDQRNLYATNADALIAVMAAEDPARFAASTLESIIVVDANLDLAMLRVTYAIADAYVSPYRSEGFNIPPLEAAACGVPVLITDGGSTDDYAHPSFACKIASRRISRDGEVRLEPDLDSTIAGMEALVEGRGGTDPATAVASIGENFTWAKAVDKLVALFGA